MDGFINILKPPGMTSHDVVHWLRKLVNIKKIGHAGTLDPDAVGVLPVALGKGTRLLEYILEADKKYRCEIIFGIKTTTQDLSGKITEKNPVEQELLNSAPQQLQNFLGEISQIPPMVSAVRHRGQRLYELARQGKSVERSPRRVIIYELKVIETNFHQEPYTMLFDVKCSKGTYIRTLCHDFGELLGCGACLSFLIRSETGGFKLEDAWTLEEIKKNWDMGQTEFLLPMAEYIPLGTFVVDRAEAVKLTHGQPLILSASRAKPNQAREDMVQIHDASGLVAIGKLEFKGQNIHLQPRKVLR